MKNKKLKLFLLIGVFSLLLFFVFTFRVERVYRTSKSVVTIVSHNDEFVTRSRSFIFISSPALSLEDFKAGAGLASVIDGQQLRKESLDKLDLNNMSSFSGRIYLMGASATSIYEVVEGQIVAKVENPTLRPPVSEDQTGR